VVVVVAGALAAALIAIAPAPAQAGGAAAAVDGGVADGGAADAGAAGAIDAGPAGAGPAGPAPARPTAAAGPPAAAAVDCDAPGRAPDPRCDDNLDGRAPPETSLGRSAARVLLLPPRAAARLAFIPLLQATKQVERYELFPRLTALTTSDDGKVGVRPELQYSTSYLPSLGLGLFYRRLPEPESGATARFRVGSAQIWRVEVGLSGPRRLGLSLGAFWDRRNDRIFAGIGDPPPDVQPVRARYRGDIYRVEALWVAPRMGPLSLVLRTGAEGRGYHPEDVRGGPSIAVAYGAPPESCAARGLPSPCVDPLQVPGFDIGRRLLYERARVMLDLRPNGRDVSGVELGFEGGYSHGIIGDPSRHVRLGFDAVGALGGIDRVLLLRFAAAVVEPVGRAPVPFDEMISPTGGFWNRGFPDGLFRDRSGVVATVEYRWLISSALDMSVFVDEGAVAGPWFSGLQRDNFRTSVGAGLRMYRRGLPRYWTDSMQQGVQIAYGRGQGIRIMLQAAAF
jgi:hypothetical protein